MEDGRRSDNQHSHLSFVGIFVLLFLGPFHGSCFSLWGSLCKYCRDVGKNLNPPGRVCRAVCINI